MTEQPTFEWTNDPADPCAYCVYWDEPEDPYSADAVPYIAPNVPATRMYRMTHDDCEAAVMQYVAEATP